MASAPMHVPHRPCPHNPLLLSPCPPRPAPSRPTPSTHLVHEPAQVDKGRGQLPHEERRPWQPRQRHKSTHHDVMASSWLPCSAGMAGYSRGCVCRGATGAQRPPSTAIRALPPHKQQSSLPVAQPLCTHPPSWAAHSRQQLLTHHGNAGSRCACRTCTRRGTRRRERCRAGSPTQSAPGT